MTRKILVMMTVLSLLCPNMSFAKPQVIELKSKERVRQEGQLKKRLEAMDIEAIEDPTAEAAIKAMMEYVGVDKKKSPQSTVDGPR